MIQNMIHCMVVRSGRILLPYYDEKKHANLDNLKVLKNGLLSLNLSFLLKI